MKEVDVDTSGALDAPSDEGKTPNLTQEETIRVVPPEDDAGTQPEVWASQEPSPISRKLGRGFTITVSPPVDFTAAHSDTGAGFDEETARMRQERFDDCNQQRLTPEEFIPDVPLDRTESRLPGLEDMLADEELRQMFNTSEAHREVQQVLVTEDEDVKYEGMVQLVQKSYQNSVWRREAAKDRCLIDALVLFCRQKAVLATFPDEEATLSNAGALFLRGRSSRLSRSLTSQSSLSRSPVRLGSDMTSRNQQSPKSPPASRNSVSEFGAVERQLVTAVAFISVTLKLLRNLCVESTECQEYIHEHRLMDFLFDHIEGLVDVIDRSLSQWNSEPFVFNGGPLPEWTAHELQSFMKSFLQLVTNAVSGNSALQAYTLHRTYPDGLLKAVLLSEDAELFACFLHNLCLTQTSDTVSSLFVDNASGAQVLYTWLVVGVVSENDAEEKECQQSESKTSTGRSPTQVGVSRVWSSVFLTALFHRKGLQQNSSLFGSLLDQLMSVDPQVVLQGGSKCCGRSCITRLGSSLSRSPARLWSRDEGTMLDWSKETPLERRCYRLVRVPKSAVLERFFTLLEDIFEAHDVSSGSSSTDEKDVPLVHQLLYAPQTQLSGLVSFFMEAGKVTSERPVKDYPSHVSMPALRAVMRALVSLSVEASKLPVKEREVFDEAVGVPVVRCVVHCLRATHSARQEAVLTAFKGKRRHTVASEPSEAELSTSSSQRRYWPAKDGLLLIANLCNKSVKVQTELLAVDGLRAVLNHGYLDDEEPLMREAAIFAIRCSCSDNNESRECLKNLLQGPFKGQASAIEAAVLQHGK